MTRKCRLIEIAGTPYERGRQYGVQAEPEIRAGISHYAAQVRDLKLEDSELARIVAAYLPSIEAFEPRYVEEMRGIADGAGVEFHHIVMINARTEVLKLATNAALRGQLLGDVEPDGCTTLIVAPAAAAAGRLIHAHNWDWKMESADASVVLRIRDEEGPDILMFAEAGALGRFGFNARGIGVTANYLECDRDYRQIGVPLALIRRHALEQTHFALALRTAYTTPKSGSNNMSLTHRDGEIFDFECAPDETFQVEPRRGVLVHANHWQSPVALAKLQERGPFAMPDSLYRDRRLRALVEPRIGSLTVDDVKATLLDDWASPWSICRPPRPSAMSNLSATVVTLVMQPALGLMEVAVLPALDPSFTSYTLEMESGVAANG
ncbi:MAG: peptidase acyl-coenzyme A:6-aminopenicillanic acid acyl-transferase [Sphingomonas bacterium]|uniref:C45 family autoproteolytic acyltransferase/hydolase n=1 Tax=Sphingomonas bacterium TaxID=1895847 RepID=UPI00261E2681|nr:C45 family peptidase [Sphingomonas bacterium]MDB5707203.1 peptidase acyl-coenzyme A:6-aminopenicillanic acid acyl-transferase [Sphingomonas bacterium]